MRGALVILIAMVVIGVVLYLLDIFYYKNKSEDRGRVISEESSINEDGADADDSGKEGDECCGLHLVCEKTSLSPMSSEIIYYDDEELDRFRGRKPEEYNREEIDEFQDVLLTLLPSDLTGWSKSLQLRGIEPPIMIRDELLMMIREIRDNKISG